jgi:outer membrane lipoprotein-sorting protein
LKNLTDREREESLLNDLEALYEVEVPNLPVPAVTSAPAASHSMRWRPVALAAAGLAGLALFLGAASPFGGSPTTVNAETILQKTAGVAANKALALPETSYHMVSKHEVFKDGALQATVMDSVNEVWYRDPEHQRSESRDGSGNVMFGTVQSGSDIWMYSTQDGETRAVHGNVDTLGFRTGVPANFGGADSLSDLLTLYSGGGCSSAKLAGEEKVAGRDTYVIEVKPTWETCPFKVVEERDGRVTVKGEAKLVEANSPNTGTAPAPQAQFVMIGGGKSDTTTKMWVDAETFINLRTETYEGGKLLFRHEVTEFATGIDIPDPVFRYTPPAGVEVVEATTPQQMKGVLSGEFGIVTFESGHGAGIGAGGEPAKVESFQIGRAAP